MMMVNIGVTFVKANLHSLFFSIFVVFCVSFFNSRFNVLKCVINECIPMIVPYFMIILFTIVL